MLWLQELSEFYKKNLSLWVVWSTLFLNTKLKWMHWFNIWILFFLQHFVALLLMPQANVKFSILRKGGVAHSYCYENFGINIVIVLEDFTRINSAYILKIWLFIVICKSKDPWWCLTEILFFCEDYYFIYEWSCGLWFFSSRKFKIIKYFI